MDGLLTRDMAGTSWTDPDNGKDGHHETGSFLVAGRGCVVADGKEKASNMTERPGRLSRDQDRGTWHR